MRATRCPSGGKLTIETSNAHLDDAYAAAQPDGEAGTICHDLRSPIPARACPPRSPRKAFDPFFTTKEVGKGTGLGPQPGLRFPEAVRRPCQNLFGAGRGTAVKLYLPRYFGDAVSGAAASVDHGSCPRSRGEVVLVVEDEERVRAHGCRVAARAWLCRRRGRATGRSALAILDRIPGSTCCSPTSSCRE